MNENSIFVPSEHFSEEERPAYDLLIAISPNRLSYAILDNSGGELRALFDNQRSIDLFKEIKEVADNSSFNSVKISYLSDNELLVPYNLLNEDDLLWTNQYFNITTPFTTVVNQQTLGFKPVMAIPDELLKVLNQAFPNAEIYHPVLPMIKLVKEDGLYIDFTATTAYCMFIKDEALIYQNSFDAINAEEFNYFLLLLLDALKLDAGVKVAVSGVINTDDGRFKVMEKYFHAVRLSLPANIPADDAVLTQLPQHYFSALLALSLCE